MAREMKDIPSEEKKLEQYGVWVKVEPQDFSPTEPTEAGFKLTDLEAPSEEAPSEEVAEIPSVPSEESFTKEEEDLLDELETEIGQEEASVPENEDLVSFAPDQSMEPEAQSLPEIAEPLSVEEGEVLPELDLDDLGGPAAGELVQEPAEVPDLMAQDVLELPDEALPESEVEAAEEALPAEIPLADEEPVADLSLSEVDVPLSEESPNVEHFDDLAALEEELATVATSTTEAVKPGSAVSGEILARIEAELKSIRTDLTELKNELTVLKKPTKARTGSAEPESEAVGFFEEDEDETIALTGDELDNILSTAEITEEPAEGAEVEEEAAGVDELPEIGTAEASLDELSDAGAAEVSLDGLPDTLTLEGGESTEPVSDLELESLGIEGESPAEIPVTAAEEELDLEPLEGAEETGPASGGDLEMELESLPEIEEAGGTAPAAEAEPIELESLEEEGTAEAAPMDLESIPEFEAAGPGDDSLSQAAEEAVAEEIDLESLSPEAEETAELPAADVLELDSGELEAIGEEGPAAEDKGIEIAFEEGGEKEAEEATEAEELVEEPAPAKTSSRSSVPDDLKSEIRTVLKYMDQLLEALPEEKIQEFASSEYFVMYKKLFEDLGLGE